MSRNSEGRLQTVCMRCPEADEVFQVQVDVNMVEQRAAKSTAMHLYGVPCVGGPNLGNAHRVGIESRKRTG